MSAFFEFLHEGERVGVIEFASLEDGVDYLADLALADIGEEAALPFTFDALVYHGEELPDGMAITAKIERP
jgi:hypothetical protein